MNTHRNEEPSSGWANIWFPVAAANGFLAVAAAALGSHAVAQGASEQAMFLYRQGADFHMSHALALIGVGVVASVSGPDNRRLVDTAGAAFQAGILMFSGTLYWMGANNGPESLGSLSILTPLGGFALLSGWAILTLATSRAYGQRKTAR